MDQQVTHLRARHGLKPSKENIWKIIVKNDMPLIIPIEEQCFGSKPVEWHQNARFTNFIYLRRNSNTELPCHVINFIETAKSKGLPLIAIGFSSMPVSPSKIFRIVNLIAGSERKPAIIVLMGSLGSVKKPLQDKIDVLKSEGRLLEERALPYSKLFPEMDCLIIHGGLGSTAEALRAGVPVIVTGVLLMDQRFWGKRVHKLGVGPEPVHITDFVHVCVDYVNKALEPGSDWLNKAKTISKEIRGESDDGVEENVRALIEFSSIAKPISYDNSLDEDWS
jgi:UDP:flavonoid glycosyltransferase YjiC (YdhE family)